MGCYSHDNRSGSAALESTVLVWNQQTATEFTGTFPGDKTMIDVYSLRSCGEPGGWATGQRTVGNWWLQNCPKQSRSRRARALLRWTVLWYIRWMNTLTQPLRTHTQDYSLYSELILQLPYFVYFPHVFFFLKGGSILLYANSVINLLGLVIDLTQSSRGSNIALNCMHHKILSP